MSIACFDCAKPSAGHVPARVAHVSDEALIKQIARKNEAALQILRRRYQGRVSRFILRFVRDRSLVEDLVGDTFFGAWQRAPYFENRSSVATWLLSIARYKALSARERRGILTEPLDDAMSATLVDPSLWADAVIEHKDTAQYLQRCLSTLPEEQALLIELVYYRAPATCDSAATAVNLRLRHHATLASGGPSSTSVIPSSGLSAPPLRRAKSQWRKSRTRAEFRSRTEKKPNVDLCLNDHATGPFTEIRSAIAVGRAGASPKDFRQTACDIQPRSARGDGIPTSLRYR